MKCAWLIFAGVCWTTGCVAEGEATGGKTNWVTCKTDDDCADVPGTSCVKKVCTEPADGSVQTSSEPRAEDARAPDPDDTSKETTTDEPSVDMTDTVASVDDGGGNPSSTTADTTTDDGDLTTDDGECFSPTQNQDQVYACTLPGCTCDVANEVAPVCIESLDGKRYALHCQDGQWEPADNRRCATDEELCFSPTQNVELASSGTINGCECPESCAEETCETCGGEPGAHLPMVCYDGRWQVASLIDCEGLAEDLCSSIVFEENCYSPTRNQDRALDAGAQGCSCFEGIEQPDCMDGTLFTCEGEQWNAEATTCPGTNLDAGPAPGAAANEFEPSPAVFTLVLTPTWSDTDEANDQQWLFGADFADSNSAWLSSAGELDASASPSGHTQRSVEAEFSLSGTRLEFEPFTVAASEGGYSFSGVSLQRDSEGLIEGTATGTWIPQSAAAAGVRPFTATIVAIADEQAPRAEIIDPEAMIRRDASFRIALSEPIWAPTLANVTIMSGDGPRPFSLLPVDDVRPGFVTEFQIVSEDDGWPQGEELEVLVHALRDTAGNTTEDPLSLGTRLVADDTSP